MSEFLPVNNEREKEPSPENSTEQKERLKKAMEAAENARNEHEDSIENIRSKINKEALSGKETSAGDIGKDKKSQSSPMIDRTAKQQTYKKTIRHIQRQLPNRQKALSKIIHQPVIESVSEFGAKTVARPSGMLGAGVFALVGTAVVVLMSRHYGFYYNFFMFIVLFVVGFFVGLVLELLLNLGKKLLRRS